MIRFSRKRGRVSGFGLFDCRFRFVSAAGKAGEMALPSTWAVFGKKIAVQVAAFNPFNPDTRILLILSEKRSFV